MSEPAAALGTNVEQAVVRHALARGYLTRDQLREALLVQRQLSQSERPADLLGLLRARYLQAEHLPELGEVYRRARSEASSARAEDEIATVPTGARPRPEPSRSGSGSRQDARLGRSGSGSQQDARLGRSGSGSQQDARLGRSGSGSQQDARPGRSGSGSQQDARLPGRSGAGSRQDARLARSGAQPAGRRPPAGSEQDARARLESARAARASSQRAEAALAASARARAVSGSGSQQEARPAESARGGGAAALDRSQRGREAARAQLDAGFPAYDGEVPAEVLERSSELLARPPEEDPEDVQRFLEASSDGEAPVDTAAPTVLYTARREAEEARQAEGTLADGGPPPVVRRGEERAGPLLAEAVVAYQRASERAPHFLPHAEVALDRLGELGHGRWSVVERARDRRLGREVALKRSKAGDERSVRRFRRETEIIARLEHPCIPPVYEAGTDATGRHFLLTRLIDGETLATRIELLHRKGRVAERDGRDLLEVLLKVGEAVAYANGEGIVHRDLRPESVHLGPFGEVLVTHWGLARSPGGADEEDAIAAVDTAVSQAADEARRAGLIRQTAVLGTPGYMPKEQINGLAVDARADVFALGALLTAILTGEPPYPGASLYERIEATLEDRIELPGQRDPSIPPELDAIARQALHLDPDRRTPSAVAFVGYLRDYLAGRPVALYRPSAVRRAAAALTSRASLAALALLLAVVAAVAIAGWLGATQGG